MTPLEFKASLPEFAAIADDVVQRHLTDADPFFDAPTWDGFYSRGLSRFVAHSIIMELVRGGWKNLTQAVADNVTSKSISGAVSWSIDASMLQLQMKDPLLKTLYGQEYVYLRDMVGTGGFVA